MAKYRDVLPQLGGNFFMSDGGIETTLVFLEGQHLPELAAFCLLQTPEGEERLRNYFRRYAELASRFNTGLVLESPTWRASPDWGVKLGYSADGLAEANRRAIRLLEEVRAEYETPETPIVISGCMGPRGDGYVADTAMSPQEARDYHRVQIETLAGTAADLVSVLTMTNTAEAIGLTLAAKDAGMPAVISFTTETDGRLPSGEPLRGAIERVDDATDGYPAYFMINCAHPTHFEEAVAADEPWVERIRALRANASRLSHVELEEEEELDIGDPRELGREYAELRRKCLTHLNVMGGCCGTDERHVEAITAACLPLFSRAA